MVPGAEPPEPAGPGKAGRKRSKGKGKGGEGESNGPQTMNGAPADGPRVAQQGRLH